MAKFWKLAVAKPYNFSIQWREILHIKQPAQWTEDAVSWSAYMVRDNWIAVWVCLFVCFGLFKEDRKQERRRVLISTFSIVIRISNSGLTSFQVSLVTLQEHDLATRVLCQWMQGRTVTWTLSRFCVEHWIKEIVSKWEAKLWLFFQNSQNIKFHSHMSFCLPP